MHRDIISSSWMGPMCRPQPWGSQVYFPGTIEKQPETISYINFTFLQYPVSLIQRIKAFKLSYWKTVPNKKYTKKITGI